MAPKHAFLERVLDTLYYHVVVLDEDGIVRFVNRSWREFCPKNPAAKDDIDVGVNYTETIVPSLALGFWARKVGVCLKKVIEKGQMESKLEYLADAASSGQWFMLRVARFEHDGSLYFVISHSDISKRKIAEEEVSALARLDPLTSIANRRSFSDFLESEWKRCVRHKKPVVLAMFDLDYFKRVNDTFGHAVGDLCLKMFADVLRDYTKRPSDLCARYGGEEFVILWSHMKVDRALLVIDKVRETFQQVTRAEAKQYPGIELTFSAGVAEYYPSTRDRPDDLIQMADELLYQAKHAGRNRVQYTEFNGPIKLSGSKGET